MTDFGTMEARIRREMNRDGLTSEIRDQIASAINFYESDRFFFNEYSASATTTTGQANLTAPTASLELDLIEIIDGGQKKQLIERNFLDIIARDDATAEPTDYAEFNDLLRLYPVPDKKYTVHMFGKQKLTEVSASASAATTNAWMTDGEVLIRTKAKEYVYEHRLRNSNEANRMRGMSEIEWTRLKKKTTDKVATGRIRRFPF
jgi:hypothetical protein